MPGKHPNINVETQIPLELKFSVCVTKGHKRPAFVALSNGMHEIRDEIFVDLLVLLVY